jgi:hypothetical protein
MTTIAEAIAASIEYDLRLLDPDGVIIAPLDAAIEFEYTSVVNDLGRVSVTLPGDFDADLIGKDNRITIWRKAPGGSLKQMFHGLLTWWQFSDDDNGLTTLKIAGASLKGILRRRIVAYTAGSVQATKTDQVDDMMKAIILENFGASAVAARQLSMFSSAADASLGPSITKSFAWDNVLDTFKKLSDAARTNGTEVYFDIVPLAAGAFEFRTYIGQPGNDRRSVTTGNPLIFSKEMGNLAQPSLTIDYDNEYNYIYAGGKGEGATRRIAVAEDSTRSGLSSLARSEGWTDARNEADTDASVQGEADSALVAGRPVIRFEGSIVDRDGARYGLDWDFGDRVQASYVGMSFDDCLIRSVHVAVNDQRAETIEAKLEWASANAPA